METLTVQEKNKRRPSTEAGDPWAALAGAILIKAVDDAREGDHQASAWLADEGQVYLDGLGLDVDPDYLQAWLEKGCPGALKRRKKPVESPMLKESACFPPNNASKRIVDGLITVNGHFLLHVRFS